MMRWLVVLLALSGCLPAATPTPGAEQGTLEIEVLAGPVCPVEQAPPDPACEPRPVEGARVVLQPGDGRDIIVAEVTSDDAGRATIGLPAGDYIVIGTEVEGVMGLPESRLISVIPGETLTVSLVYDTGIR